MKPFLLAVLLVCGLDKTFNRGQALSACWSAAHDLVTDTQQEVGTSVYRS